MGKHIIFVRDSGKIFAVVPAFHATTERLIDRTESAGKHAAELVYDDLACYDCGTESGVKLHRNAVSSLVLFCKTCFSN